MGKITKKSTEERKSMFDHKKPGSISQSIEDESSLTYFDSFYLQVLNILNHTISYEILMKMLVGRCGLSAVQANLLIELKQLDFFNEENLKHILNDSENDLQITYSVLIKLKEKNLLKTQYKSYFPAIIKYPYDAADILSKLQEGDLLKSENAAFIFPIMQQRHYRSLDEVITQVRELKEFYQACVKCDEDFANWVIQNETLCSQAKQLEYLLKPENTEYRGFIKEAKDPLKMTKAFGVLQKNNILNAYCIQKILQHSEPRELAVAFFWLNKEGVLLSPEYSSYIQKICDHPKPIDIAWFFISLNQSGLSLEENFEPLFNHPNILDINYFQPPDKEQSQRQSPFSILKTAGLWSLDHFEKLLSVHKDHLSDLLKILNILSRNTILNLNSLNLLMEWKKSDLCTYERLQQIKFLKKNNLLSLESLSLLKAIPYSFKHWNKIETLAFLKVLDLSVFTKAMQHPGLNKAIKICYLLENLTLYNNVKILNSNVTLNILSFTLEELQQAKKFFSLIRSPFEQQEVLEFIFNHSDLCFSYHLESPEEYYSRNDAETIVHTLEKLLRGSILEIKYFKLCLLHRNPIKLADGLVELEKCDLLNDEFIQLIKDKDYPKAYAQAFGTLQEANLLQSISITEVVQHQDPYFLALGYSKLQHLDLLSEYQDLIKAHQKPADLAEKFKDLKEFTEIAKVQGYDIDFATDENRKFLATCDDPHHALPILILLKLTGLWSTANFNLIYLNLHLFSLFGEMVSGGLVNQENLNYLRTYFLYQEVAECFSQISDYLVTSTVARHLLKICRDAKGDIARGTHHIINYLIELDAKFRLNAKDNEGSSSFQKQILNSGDPKQSYSEILKEKGFFSTHSKIEEEQLIEQKEERRREFDNRFGIIPYRPFS